MEEILENLEDHPQLGLKRKLEFKGFDFLRVDTLEMQLIFIERFLDVNGKVINSDIVKNREIRYYVSNSNIVNANGIVITLERVRSVVNIRAGESQEDYNNRTENIYNNQLSQGTPQFNWYVQKFFIPNGIREIIGILKTENKIDSK